MYDEDSDYEMDYEGESNEVEYVAEFAAYERMNIRKQGQGLSTDIGGGLKGKKLRDMYKIIQRVSMTDQEKFTTILVTYFNDLKDKEIITFTEYDLRDILSIVSRIPAIKYKNALATLLGYYTLDSKKNISKTKFNTLVIEILPKIESDIVTAPDILRYAILLRRILNEV